MTGARATSAAPSLEGRRILVVEDDFLVAEEITHGLERHGAEVLGPAPTVRAALALLDAEASLDAAVLDVDLRGEPVYPAAEALRRRGVPFAFATGYEVDFIDPRFAEVPVCQKPVNARQLAEALLRPPEERQGGALFPSQADRSRP